jgi:hypothetical protein
MPTLAGFLIWIRTVMGIPANYLPTQINTVVDWDDPTVEFDEPDTFYDITPVITTAYQVAVSIANIDMANIDPSIYALMVYNLAGDNLINYAPDQLATITGITWAAGAATVTTAFAHGFVTGNTIQIAGNAPLAYNSQPGPAQTTLGTQIVVTGATTFVYSIAANPGALAQAGTASGLFFANLRQRFNCSGFVPGVISASNDETTGQSILNPDFMKTLTLGNLQNLKTPYGRQYLALAQDYGQVWGLS